MKVLVAGASGVIGREVVRRLAAGEHAIRTLSQNPQRAAGLRAFTSDIRIADATQPGALVGVCDGVDVVISALGAPVLPGAARRSFAAVDVAANRALVEEARRAGVRRFVYVGVFTTPAYADSVYARAHAQVEDLVRASGLEYGFVRTTGVFGALAELVAMARRGRVPLIGNGSATTNPVHETDVAEAVDRAATAATSTEENLGGPEVLSRRQIAALAFAACGKRPRLMALPVWSMRLIGWLYGLANRRMADLLAFVIRASTNDCVAPAVGRRTLGPYFADVAKGSPHATPASAPRG
jgi:uncharacterized protein YbjT (DUF2867 family)